MADVAKDVYNKVKKIADEYGIPEWVWLPILKKESGGNPNAHASTDKEDSRGLFQINIMAHPQWAGTNLYDPETNAKIAFENFIAPAWDKVKTRTDLNYDDKTAYVWRYGIRPKWTDEKEASIKAEAQKVYKGNLGLIDKGIDWADNAAGQFGNSLSNWASSLLGWATGTPSNAPAPSTGGGSSGGGSTGSDSGSSSYDPDRVILFKESWLTPEIGFSKSKAWTVLLVVILTGIGLYLLFMFFRSLTDNPAVIVEGETA